MAAAFADRIGDAEQTQFLFSPWEIVRFRSSAVPWPYPPDGAITHYRDVALAAVERGEEWPWSIRTKAHPAQIIGCIRPDAGERDNRGFWPGLPWQGRGLMTEASEAVTGYRFERLGFPALRAPKAVANIASRRISEQHGRPVVAPEERKYVSGRLLTEIREITAEGWRARRGIP